MNIWTQRSIELANQRNYLDLLFRVYPLSANERREIAPQLANTIKQLVQERKSKDLLNLLLDQVKNDGESHPFPLKYSYVSYFKKDRGAIDRNPKTVERIAGYLYEIGVGEILTKMAAPKETNRQMGALFKEYLNSGTLGLKVAENEKEFLSSYDDMIYNCSDLEGKRFAMAKLGYQRDKGLDFIGRVSGKYVIGEAKFLTDYGGHQNAQLNDAMDTLETKLVKTGFDVRRVAIIDGVAYIVSNDKMHKTITSYRGSGVIVSAVLLREFLGSL